MGLSYINNALGWEPGYRGSRGQHTVRKWRAQGRPRVKLGREGERGSELRGSGSRCVCEMASGAGEGP